MLHIIKTKKFRIFHLYYIIWTIRYGQYHVIWNIAYVAYGMAPIQYYKKSKILSDIKSLQFIRI